MDVLAVQKIKLVGDGPNAFHDLIWTIIFGSRPADDEGQAKPSCQTLCHVSVCHDAASCVVEPGGDGREFNQKIYYDPTKMLHNINLGSSPS